MLTAEAAAEIRMRVWPRRLQKAYAGTPGFYDHCACEYGMSGHCETGHHNKCSSFGPKRPVSTETYILSRRGPVASLPDGEGYARVWLADRRCFWNCKCPCHRPGWGGKTPPVGQLDLLALLGGQP